MARKYPIGKARHTSEWGFGKTNFDDVETFKKLLSDYGLTKHTIETRTYGDGIYAGSYDVQVWSRPDGTLNLYTAFDPIREVIEGGTGYVGRVGIDGAKGNVISLAAGIKLAAEDTGGESPGERMFI